MKYEIDNTETNGKLFFLIAVFIIFLLSISYRLFAQTNIIYSVELEDLGHINLELNQYSTASNHYFLRMPDSVSLNFDAPEDNYYSLQIRYRAFDSSKEEYIDKISVFNAIVTPSIKPQNNIFYKNCPRDLKIIVDNYKYGK